jgi:hypothetical protein
MARHNTLTLRKPEALSKAAATVTKRNIDIFFEKLHTFIVTEGHQEIFSRPEAFFNLDESGFDLNTPPDKVLTSKRIRHTYCIEQGVHHKRLTVTVCVAANGFVLPTQVILPKGFSRMLDLGVAIGGEN